MNPSILLCSSRRWWRVSGRGFFWLEPLPKALRCNAVLAQASTKTIRADGGHKKHSSKWNTLTSARQQIPLSKRSRHPISRQKQPVSNPVTAAMRTDRHTLVASRASAEKKLSTRKAIKACWQADISRATNEAVFVMPSVSKNVCIASISKVPYSIAGGTVSSAWFCTSVA